jgi:hypothetical protein
MSMQILELRYQIEKSERRFNEMRQLVEAKGYDWDMIDLKRMQRELDDLIKRYEERMSKQLGCMYRYGSSAVAPQVGTHPFNYHSS